MMLLETTWTPFWSLTHPLCPCFPPSYRKKIVYYQYWYLSLFNHSQTIRAMDLKLSNNVHPTLCVMCTVSCVIIIFFFSFLENGGVGWLRVCYPRGLPSLVLKLFLIKNALIPNIYLSRLVVVRFWQLKKANLWESNFRNIGISQNSITLNI